MATLVPEMISVLRDIRDIKYPDIIVKHGEVAVNAGLTLGYKDTALTYKNEASASASSALANKVITDANVVITNNDKATTNADASTCTAKALIASQVLAMTASASTLVAGSPASASYNPTTGIMSLGIPTGPKGDKGDAFVINALGTFAGRSAYDLQPINFTYYATDIGEIYFKLSATSGDWSVGSPFGKGDTGDAGNGIESITLTGSVANVDTYRILYTDATFFDFDVTNGSVTSVAGRTGAITLAKTDVGLSNVDNTSDLLKPVSIAQQTALNLKLDAVVPTTTKSTYTSILVDGVELTIPAPALIAGKDLYFSKTEITTVSDANTIGGFHYSLVPHAEAATGNKTEADMVKLRGINAYSIWTLWDRPICPDPRGKAKVGSRWYDIYLMDRDYAIRGYSAPTVHTGANIAGGVADATYFRQIPKIPLAYGGDGTVTYGKYTWFQACEVATATGNQNISYNEFPTIAYGVLEGVDSSAYGDNGTIFHIPQLMSKYGIEMATGTEYVWGADVGGNSDIGSVTWAYRDKADARGQIYALHDNHITAVLFGGARTYGVSAGSRASHWNGSVWNSNWNIGSRFACDCIRK